MFGMDSRTELSMACNTEAADEELLQFIVDFEWTPEEIASFGVHFCRTVVGDGISILYISPQEYAKAESYLGRYYYVPQCYGLMEENFDTGSFLMQDNSPVNLQPLDAAGIIQMQNPPLSLTGQGVITAFLDTGIDYTLPHFRTEEGKSRILAIWDQTLSAEELNAEKGDILERTGINITYAPPEGFDYGVLFTREQIDLALSTDNPFGIVPSSDENGHGTKMASVASGSFLERNGFRGAAYESGIVVVKLRQSPQYLKDFYLIPQGIDSYSDPDILLALKFLQSYLVPFERPVCICIGVGNSFGSHIGSTLLSRYIEHISQKRNQVVVVTGGNEGNTAGHFHGSVPLRSSQNWVDAELLVAAGEEGFVLELWRKLPNVFSVEITSPAGEFIPKVPYRVGQSISYRFVYSDTVLSVNHVIVEQATGEELIQFRFERPLEGIWQIRVYAEGDGQYAQFDLWLPIRQFRKTATGFLRPDPDTTLTAPAYSRGALSITTYQSVNNSLYLSSGRGFAADGYIQPDFAAPGVGVSTALGTDSGSSLSAAMTAGAVADFLQWAVVEKNDLLVNTDSIRSYLIRGASRDENMVYPNNIWGYGRLNLAETFDKIAGVTYR